MKRSTNYLLMFLVLVFVLSGCAIGNLTVAESQKAEITIAALIGATPPLTSNHWAGIAQADADISVEPVSLRHLAAITKWCDPLSLEYKEGYLGIAKAYYEGYKLEGAIKKFMKKLTDYGLLFP